jgi:hypothetical protein
VTRFYDIDDANAAVPELDEILATLAAQRAELIRLRDDVLARRSAASQGDEATEDAAEDPAGERQVPSSPAEIAVAADELRLTRLRMQGLVDQMAAGVARIETMGITLRDIGDGLVDFPALVSGRQVWLCWRRGEESVGFWHPIDTGFSSRQPLSELT